METNIQTKSPDMGNDIQLLSQGKAPYDADILEEITVGTDTLTDFIDAQYLSFYIREGGSKIKFLTGRAGTGKTHLSRILLAKADRANYLTVSFSARDIWLHDFREMYLEILRQCDLNRVLKGCADTIIAELGYQPAQIADHQTFMDYLAEQGQADAITKSEIRTALRKNFTKNALLDNTFASCCSLLVGSLLGHPVLEPANRDLIYAFLHGDKTIKLSMLRSLGLSPSRITKHNARHLLRSLSEIVHMAGFSGILIVVDDLEVLQKKSTDSPVRYTKMKREDVYESIRQLIDDIDSMRYLFFLFCFDRELIDNENYGLKSYQALWFRIQNEVVSTRFNRFADMIDLDRLIDSAFTTDTLIGLSSRLEHVLTREGYAVHTITQPEALDLIDRSRYGGIGLPYLVIKYMMEGGERDA